MRLAPRDVVVVTGRDKRRRSGWPVVAGRTGRIVRIMDRTALATDRPRVEVDLDADYADGPSREWLYPHELERV